MLSNLLFVQAIFMSTLQKEIEQYFTMGAGVKYNVFALDFSYLIDASSSINGSNPLCTLRFTLIFDFGALGPIANHELQDRIWV